MKYVFILTAFCCLDTSFALCQDLEDLSSKILEEGLALYRNEMASWISTDSFPEYDKSRVGGYFTYSELGSGDLISVYADTSENKAVKKFYFQLISDTNIRLIKSTSDVPLTEEEKTILKVRNKALTSIQFMYQSLGYSEAVQPNVIIHRTHPEFEVYVIPGAIQYGLVPIGGDYLLRYDRQGLLKKMEFIHNNLIPFFDEQEEGLVGTAHEHINKRMGKAYVTPTDICTLLLYRKLIKDDKHTVIHKKFISEFYFDEPKLSIRPNTEKIKLKKK